MLVSPSLKRRGNQVAEIVEVAELESTMRYSVPGTDPARNVTLLTACPTVGANCRGFVTSDVMDDFVGVGLCKWNVSELWIAGHEEDNVFYPGSAPQCEVKTYVLPTLDWY